MKLILGLFIVSVLSAQPTLSLSGAPVKPKTQATLNLTLAGAAGTNLAGIQWTVQLPSGITPAVTVGAAATTAVKALDCRQTGTTLICIVSGINTNIFADGVIAQLKFTPQSAGTLNFGLSGTLGASLSGDAVTVGAVAPFGFAVTSPCDVNSDGVTDAVDVQSAIAMSLAGGACTADLDGDGKCTVIDVVRVSLAATGQNCKAN